MNNMLKKSPARRKGQALVEFALVFPVLMAVVIGLIEAGRMIFIYGSNVTASRQAIRYGSATGLNDGGTRKYLDCSGIQTEAESMGFLANVTNVQIKYYDGDTGNEIHDCTDGNPTADMFKNGDRIEVQTTTHYEPILSFIPAFKGFDMVSSSRRTIFIGITIEATSQGSGTTGGVEFTKSASPTSYTAAGETIQYSFKVDNTGSSGLSFSIEDPKVTNIDCGGQSTLAAGAQITCTASYTTTDTDVAAGDLVNTAKVTATFDDDGSVNVQQDSATVTYVEQAVIGFEKTAEPTFAELGDTINYHYTISNLGNTDLDTFQITDDKLGSIPCTGSIPVGGSPLVCQKSYTVTQADVDAGSIYNEATATAGNLAGAVSDPVTDNFTVVTSPLGLSFEGAYYPSSSPSPSTPQREGDVIEYRFQLINYTDTDMDNPEMTLTISRQNGDAVTTQPGTIDCLDDTLNANNGQTTCIGYYTLEQADLDAGGILLKTAVATAAVSSKSYTSNEVTESSVSTYITPDIDLSLEVSLTGFGGTNILNESNPPVLDELTDSTLYYTYTITNTGNVGLDGTDFWIYDTSETVAEAFCDGSFSNLLPNATTTCTVQYDLQDADWARGSIIHTEVAYTDYVAWDGSIIPTTSDPAFTYTIFTYDGDRLTLSIIGPPGDNPISVGDIIEYTYILQNTGSTTLSPIASLNDYPITSSLTNHSLAGCEVVSSDAPPGDVIKVCDASYQVLAADVVNGTELPNTGTARAENSAGNELTPPATRTLTLEVVPIQICESDQWLSSRDYQTPDTVFFCDGGTCAEWKAINAVANSNNLPGYAPPGAPKYWEKQYTCVLDRTCDVSISSHDLNNNISNHSLNIQNNSGFSIEIETITLSWSKWNLTSVSLGGTSIPGASSSSNGGFTLPGGPWIIGDLNTIPANTGMNMNFSKKTNGVNVTITFTDDYPNVCSGITISAP